MQEFLVFWHGWTFKGSCHCWTKYNISPLMFCNGRISFKSYLQSSVLSDLKAERAVETGPRKQFLLSYCAPCGERAKSIKRSFTVSHAAEPHLQYMLQTLLECNETPYWIFSLKKLRWGIDINLRNLNVHFTLQKHLSDVIKMTIMCKHQLYALPFPNNALTSKHLYFNI